MMERITHLTAPPVIGRRYLVPTVTYPWLYSEKPHAWPVFLPLHEDGRFFNFKDLHYHPDPRFLGGREWAQVTRYGEDRGVSALAACQAIPLSRMAWGSRLSGQRIIPHPRPAWRVRTCHRTSVDYAHRDRKEVQALAAHYAGQQCKKARAGWVCPHQNWPMGSLSPDAEGVITCPLHGLRVRASDGVVL